MTSARESTARGRFRAWFPPVFFAAVAAGALAVIYTHLFVPSSVARAGVAALLGREYAAAQLPAFDRNPFLVHAHAAIGFLLIVVAPFQFWRGFRNRNRPLHKAMGYLAITCLTLLSVSGLAVAIVYPFAGPAGLPPNALWMVLILFAVACAWISIRRRNFIEHENWMARAMAVALGVTFASVYLPFLNNVLHLPARQALAISFWLGVGECLLIAELWLRRPDRPGARSRGPRARYLKLRLPLGRGLKLRIVERPRFSLAAKECDALLEDLRRVARTVLPEGELTYGVLTGERARLENAVVTLIYDASGAPVAFNALSIMPLALAGQPVEVFHLGLVMVDPKLRGRGLTEMLYGLTCVLLFLSRQFRPVRISNVTQVPAVFGMVAETFDQVFPTPDNPAGPRFEQRMLARQIMAGHRGVFGVGPEAEFDERRFVIMNSYTGGSDDLKKTFAEAPKHRHAQHNDMCARELDYQRGDDFLQIGQLNIEAARRYVSRVATPQSAPWLAGQLTLFAIQSAIMPLWHWFDDDQAWGVLRPWRSVRQ